MLSKLIRNDIRNHKLLSAAAVFFMAVSAMLLTLTVLLFSQLLGSVGHLMEAAQVPDFLQMHAGEWDEAALSGFAASRPEVRAWQVCRFLNIENSKLTLGGHSLLDSTQDNGLAVQSGRFDFLLGMDGRRPEVLPSEVYVPACYRARYGLATGDVLEIGGRSLAVAGFIRDAQMNAMMSSSKRFLVSEADYESLKEQGEEEYLIEFLLRDGADANAFQTAYAAQGLPSNGPAITKPLIRMVNALSDGTMIFVLLLVSVVVLLISLLCLRFLLSLRMEQDRKAVGMLKALGIGRRAVRQLYFAKYILFSACGALLGLAAAAILQRPLAAQLQELYGTADQGLQTGVAAALALLLAEGLILLSLWRALKQADRLSALEALFTAPNTRPGRGQPLLIGFMTAACAFLLLVPQNLAATLSSPRFATYMGIGGGEIRMDIRQAERTDTATAQIAAALEQDAQVERYAVLETRACPAVLPDGSALNLTVEMGDHSVFPVRYSAGTMPKGETEIALSSLNAKELGLSVGDSLRLTAGGKEAAYTVCGIYSDITNGGKTAKISGRPDGTPAIWSVIYVSLHESTDKERWMARYRGLSAEVTDIAGYVQGTYAQTLAQLRLAARAALFVAVLVVFVVVALFLRLIVERERSAISLRKALGFTCGDLKRAYFARGFFPAAAGTAGGLVLGSLLGERLCGWVLQGFGADGFRFVIAWKQMLAGVPAAILGTAALAVWAGISEIERIGASECCRGKE